MGQSVTVESKPQEEFCIFTTDRGLTGQDGARFSSIDDIGDATDFPATLASRLFQSDGAIDHVYIASNDVIVRRAGEWDSASVETVSRTIGDLFRFYE